MKTLNVLLVLSHERREILACEVAGAPTGAWAAERVVEALDFPGAPRLLLRDRDQKFGDEFNARLKAAGVRQALSAHRCPWQNRYVERTIGTIRRECLDHVIVLGESQLRRVLRDYVECYDESRTHLGLGGDCPVPRAVEPPSLGRIRKRPLVGGLHHRHYREAV